MADRLQANEHLRDATLVVRYEDLCSSPDAMVRRILAHCHVTAAEPVIDAFSGRLSAPDYYTWQFTDDEREAIREETQATAVRFGYAV